MGSVSECEQDASVWHHDALPAVIGVNVRAPWIIPFEVVPRSPVTVFPDSIDWAARGLVLEEDVFSVEDVMA
jgi:hypothetical protein